jgi:hypothetical protein
MDSVAPPSAGFLLRIASPGEIGENIRKAYIGTVHGD